PPIKRYKEYFFPLLSLQLWKFPSLLCVVCLHSTKLLIIFGGFVTTATQGPRGRVSARACAHERQPRAGNEPPHRPSRQRCSLPDGQRGEGRRRLAVRC